MASSLYVQIRGDYKQFQKDMNELRGIARKSAVAVSEAFEHAFSPKLFKSGLQQVGLAIKSLNAAASKMGTAFEPSIARLNDLAKACSVSEAHMQSLVNRMAEAAHQKQLENSLRTLQRQLNLTNSELAKLQREAGDVAGSVNTSLKSIGVRSTASLHNELIETARAFAQIKIAAKETKEDTTRYVEAMREKIHQLRREMMTESGRKRDDYNQLVSKYTTAKPTTKGFEAYAQTVKLKDAMSSFQEVNGRLPRTISEMRQLAQATGATTAQVRRLRDELQKSSGFFNTIIESVKQKVFFGLGAAFVDSIKTAMRVENVEVAFQAIYGTADMAAKKLSYVKQVSDQLGLSFLDTAEGAKKLFAAAQGTPVEKDANMVFKSFSDMSAALKLTSDETKGVFLALSQMISKGKVSAEELRQQLAERMPGAVNMFARSIGVTTQQLDKMLQKGEVTLEHFVKFSAEVGKTYAGGAAQASHSLQAELNRVGNTWVEFQTKSANTGAIAEGVRQINSMLKGTLDIVAQLAPHVTELTSIGVAGWIAASLVPGGKLNTVLQGLAAATMACVKPIGAFIAATASAVVGAGSLTAALKALGKAMWTMAKNPAFLALMAAGSIAVYALTKDSDEAKEAFEGVSASMDEIIAKRRELAKSGELANFSPEKRRDLLMEDAQKGFETWDAGIERVEEKYRKLMQTARTSRTDFFGEMSDEEGYRKQGEAFTHARDQLAAWRKELEEAVNLKDSDRILNMRDTIEEGFPKLAETMERAGWTKDQIKTLLDEPTTALRMLVESEFGNISNWLSTFATDTISAAKSLGLNIDGLKKTYEGLAKAAGSTELGKSLESMKNYVNVMRDLGDTSASMSVEMAENFDSTAAACGKYSSQIVTLTQEVAGATLKYSEHKDELAEINYRYEDAQNAAHDLSLSEEERYQAMIESCRIEEELTNRIRQDQEESETLKNRKEELTQAILNASMAAGGSQQAFDIMIAVFQRAAQAARMTADEISMITAQLQILRAVAQVTANSRGEEALRRANNIKEAQGARSVAMRKGRKGRSDAINATYRIYAEQNKLDPEKFINDPQYKGIRGQLDRSVDIEYGNSEALKAAGKGGRGKGGDGKRVDNTAEKWKSAEEGWRKKIADMQGQKDVQTLAKDFADMDKQLKGSSVDMKALKKDYLEAFSGKYANDLNKEILQLRGNEAELAKIDIEEKYKAKAAAIEGMAEEAKKLGITVEDQTPKLKEYRKLLEGQAREQQLQKELPYYEKFSWFDGMKNEALAKQNELIAIQAEKMKGTIPDELIDRWRQIEELQNRVKNGNDAIAGVALGAKKYALEMGNFAENMSDLVNKSFGDMADAFTDFVMTGKASFSDLANSIIKDLMRIAIQQAIVGPIANGIGNLFGGLFNLGGSSGPTTSSGVVTPSGFGVGAGIEVHALGGAFTGLHGFSNQIVNRPTLFSYGSQLTKFAKGGVMGEAGPEAVMPLTRTASGHLGVRSDGSNAPIVNVVINNSTGQQASQRTKTDNQGNKSIEVMIGDMAAQQMLKSGSSLNRAVRTFSGQSQQVTRR